MGYFPFFMDLSERSGLIAGGGAVALRKAGKLLPFGPRLTVVAPQIHPALRQLPVEQILQRPFSPEDLRGRQFVIAATGSRRTNLQIAELCRAEGILVDVADDGAAGTFLFPALIQRGALTVGITTGGTSPGAARYFRSRIEAGLPEHLEEILDFIQLQRQRLKQRVPEERQRRLLLRTLLEQAMEQERPLTDAEVRQILRNGAEGEA